MLQKDGWQEIVIKIHNRLSIIESIGFENLNLN